MDRTDSLLIPLFITNNSPTIPGDETDVNITLIGRREVYNYIYKWQSIDFSGQIYSNKSSVLVKLNVCNHQSKKTVKFTVSYQLKKNPQIWLVIAKNETFIDCKGNFIFTHKVHACIYLP